MELIGMSDKVLYESEKLYDDNGFLNDRLKNIINYANFLKMKLELWMFIPCDKEGNPIKDPTFNSELSYAMAVSLQEQYQEAKDRVIFEGFEFEVGRSGKVGYIMRDGRVFIDFWMASGEFRRWNYKTIEDLTSLGLTITPQAIKKYNLTN